MDRHVARDAAVPASGVILITKTSTPSIVASVMSAPRNWVTSLIRAPE
jgi:hypothetical protein